MVKITLPKGTEAELIAGVRFTAGVAEVAELSPNRRTYFELLGATVDGDDLTNLSAGQLRARIPAGVEIPANAKKVDLIAIIESSPQPTADDQQS